MTLLEDHSEFDGPVSNGVRSKPRYKVLPQDHGQRSKWKIICIGAGASGLYLAYTAARRMQDYELTIYEKNDDVAGTWLENRYPGCACDIPSHIYTYSFRPNPNYSAYYAPVSEIFDYFKSFEQEHNLSRFIQYSSKVQKATWNDEEGVYDVEILQPNGQIKKDWCNSLVNCSGILNKWKWPRVPGLHDFKGKLLHSANWDTTADFSGLRVGVIGIGSSGIQIIPQVQKVATHLQVFARSPVWITPQLGGLHDAKRSPCPEQPKLTELLMRGREPFKFTEAEMQAFRDDPELLLTFRKALELQICDALDYCKMGSQKQAELHKMCKDHMESILASKPDLQKNLIPTWAVGCRRPTPGAGFLEALVAPNTDTTFSGIKNVTETGITTADGIHHEMDMLICATGFDIGFIPHFELKGKNGIDIQDTWNPDPNSYLGVAAPGFPNYFTSQGPRGPWANGSVLVTFEQNLDNFISMCQKMQSEGIKSMMPSQQATDDFAEHSEEWNRDTVWNEPCSSWYKRDGPNGKAYIWPGSIPGYMKTHANVRWEDFEYDYKYRNRFAFMGSGKPVSSALPLNEQLNAMVGYVRNDEKAWKIDEVQPTHALCL